MKEHFRKEAQRLQQLDSRPEDDDHTEGPSTTEANTQTVTEDVLDASTQTTDAARKPTPPPLPPAAERMPEECEDPDLFPQSPLPRVAEARQPKNLFFLYIQERQGTKTAANSALQVPLLGTCGAPGPSTVLKSLQSRYPWILLRRTAKRRTLLPK